MSEIAVAINTNCLKEKSLSDALDIISGLGCKYVEFSTDGFLHAYEYFDTGIEPDMFLCRGLECIVLSGGWCDFVTGETADLSKQIKICSDLNLTKIRLFVSNPRREADPSADSFKASVKNIRLAAEEYEDYCLMFENHGGLTATWRTTADLLRAINKPNTGLVFDPVNFMVSGEDPLDAFDYLFPWIMHVHVKDIRGREFCEVGKGITPWKELIRRLKTVEYVGYLSIEHEKGGTLRNSYNALKDLLYE